MSLAAGSHETVDRTLVADGRRLAVRRLLPRAAPIGVDPARPLACITEAAHVFAEAATLAGRSAATDI